MAEEPLIFQKPVMGKWVVWYGMFIFWAWGVLVIFYPLAMQATPLSSIADLFGRSPLGVSFALLTAATAAVIAIYSNRIEFLTRVLLFPQVFLMLIACSGSVQAVLNGRYNDGTVRDWSFIFADQLPWIASSLIFVIAVLQQFGKQAGDTWTIGFRSWRL